MNKLILKLFYNKIKNKNIYIYIYDKYKKFIYIFPIVFRRYQMKYYLGSQYQ